MRTATIVLTACAALVLAAALAASGPAPSRAGHVEASSAPALAAAASMAPALAAAAPMAPAAASASCGRSGGPLFGVARAAGGRIFARIGRRTLRALPARSTPLPTGVYGSSWDFSPTCEAVALGGHRGRVVIVDLERGRRIGSLSLDSRSAVTQVAWPRADRLTGLTGPFKAPRVVTVSVPGGRVIGSRRIGGRPWASEATSLGLLILAGPGDRIGSATLVLANPDGGLLRVPLPRVRAGFDQVNARQLARQVIPGLAVDATAGRAYVVAANEPLVAAVDLANGTVAYHELRGGGGAAAAPVAAKGLAYGAYRTARWVGDGTIAVSGEVTRTRPDRRRAARRLGTVTRTDPYGLRLIRTADWTATTLNPLLQSFTLTRGLLFGMNADPASLAGAAATGLVVYETGGRRRFTRFRGHGRAWLRDVAWPYAYVREISPRRTLVVDLRTGRTVGETGSRRPPVLLVR